MFVKVASKIMLTVHFVCLVTTMIKTKKVPDTSTFSASDSFTRFLALYKFVCMPNIHQFFTDRLSNEPFLI